METMCCKNLLTLPFLSAAPLYFASFFVSLFIFCCYYFGGVLKIHNNNLRLRNSILPFLHRTLDHSEGRYLIQFPKIITSFTPDSLLDS